eukprot:GHUV01004944.1.p1 GENE.GHUV01004944.1~~GHUV01004944.1.p1  ORF type:complete len:937 (+),score=344.31 GHUV01004944.1:194-3004(+)
MGCTAQEAEQEAEPANINSLPSSLLHAVFAHLGPKDLCSVSATCVLWSKLTKDRASNNVWKRFYTSRWRVTGTAGDEVCWQSKYGSKMKQGKSWTGKYEHDSLYGHKAGVKSLKLLPSHGMLLSGSLDRTVRLWDLNYGMPLSISRPHGGIVRSVALDQQLVASGSSDNVVRLWHARNATAGASLLDPVAVSDAAALVQDLNENVGLAVGLMQMDAPADRDAAAAAGRTLSTAGTAVASSSSLVAQRGGVPFTHGPYSVITGEADESMFDLALPAQQLRGHIGPVTSLCLADSCLYSGSWDYTVRCWRRGSWDCISVLKYQDWVWSVVARGGMLLVASGPEVHVHDLPTGKVVRKFQDLHEGNVSCVEGTYSGKLLLTGGADGLLMVHDLRMKDPSRVLWHHNAGVHGLALEDPWLVSAASDGTVVMHNLEQALPNNLQTGSAAGSSFSGTNSSMARRNLNCQGHGGGPMYCVDIADSWLASGGESPTIRLWDFTKAAEAAARATAARAARNSSKRAMQRKAAEAAAGEGGKAGRRGGDSSSAAGGRAGSSKTGCTAAAAGGGGGGNGGSGAGSSRAAAAGSAAAVDYSSSNSSMAAGGASSSDSSQVKKPKGMLAVAAAAAKTAASSNRQQNDEQAVAPADRYHRMQHAHVARQQQQQVAVADAADQPEQPSATARGKVSHGKSRTSKQRGHHSNGYHGHVQGYSHGQTPGGYHDGYSGSPQFMGGYGSSPHQQYYNWSSRPHGGSPQQHWYGASPPLAWQHPSGRPGGYPASGQQQHRSASSRGTNTCSTSQPQASSRQTSTSSGEMVGVPIPKNTPGSSHRNPAAGPRSAVSGAAAEGGDSSGGDGTLGLSASPCAATAGCSYRVPFSSSYPSATQTGPWLVTGSSPRYDIVVGPAGIAASSGGSGPRGPGVSALERQTGLPADLTVPGSLSS